MQRRSSPKRWCSALGFAALASAGLDASARNEFVDYAVAAAMTAEHSDKLLRDVPVFMQGQPHPGVARSIGSWRANRPARSAMTSDERACQRAFLSAVISLQQRAKQEGGNAVVDIVSDTRGNLLESATQYRCVVGNIVANVALRGTVVTLGEAPADIPTTAPAGPATAPVEVPAPAPTTSAATITDAPAADSMAAQ